MCCVQASVSQVAHFLVSSCLYLTKIIRQTRDAETGAISPLGEHVFLLREHAHPDPLFKAKEMGNRLLCIPSSDTAVQRQLGGVGAANSI